MKQKLQEVSRGFLSCIFGSTDRIQDRAVGLTLHNEDATTEELLAQIPPDRVNCGGEIPRPFNYRLQKVMS
jgi:hypothetical protein